MLLTINFVDSGKWHAWISFGGVKIGDVTDSDKTYSSDSDDFGRVDYNQFVAPLVKAVQQLSSKIDLLEARIDELEE